MRRLTTRPHTHALSLHSNDLGDTPLAMPLIHMSCVWWSAPWTTVSSLSSSSVSPLSSSACSSTCTTCGGGGGGVNTGWGGRLGGLALWLYTRIRQPVFEAPRQGVPLAFPTVSLITSRHSWARPETGGRLRNYVCSSSRAGKGMGGAAVRARSRPTHLVPDVKGEGGVPRAPPACPADEHCPARCHRCPCALFWRRRRSACARW